MNILITGCGGFIGKYIKNNLDQKFNVFGINSQHKLIQNNIIYSDLSNDQCVKNILLFIKSSHAGTFYVGNKSTSILNLAKNLIKKYGNKSSKIKKNKLGKLTIFFLNMHKLNKIQNSRI